ncbi:hypothetical protein DYY65_04920 [Nitrososphaera sp. AFS]|nr:hypothetical protein [Nitrososphaera sp. AFS]
MTLNVKLRRSSDIQLTLHLAKNQKKLFRRLQRKSGVIINVSSGAGRKMRVSRVYIVQANWHDWTN